MISSGNNDHVASGVTFVNHDITALMFCYMENNSPIQERKGEIVISVKVFIGSNSTVLYDVTIGSNVIIGAGSIENKSIPFGSVVAGVSYKVIGKYDDHKDKIVYGFYEHR